jgi:alpha-ketoglutarate-dependent taurine dioxygenase
MKLPPPQYETQAMTPYGLELHAGGHDEASSLDADWIAATTLEHRLLLLRGFRQLAKDELVVLLEWNFGHVLELQIHPEPKNYLFTEGNVPYHWDGAFAEVVPRFQVFQCLETDGDGGETTFCDTIDLLKAASVDEVSRWRQINISYQTEKQAHYGGEIKRPLVSPHPVTGEPTIRFAEPLNEQSVKLNPLYVQIEGYSATAQQDFLASFIPRLYQPPFYYEHRWQRGDLLITDNHALLHGRTPLSRNVKRRLQRVHVI